MPAPILSEAIIILLVQCRETIIIGGVSKTKVSEEKTTS